jgi:hypothetical protein
VSHYPGGHDDVANAACGAIVRVHSNASIVRDEPPSLGLVEEVVTEEEKIKSAFDSELMGKKKKSKDEEGLDENFNPDEWDISQWSATQIAEELRKIEGKKAKEPLVKFFRKWG